ncbi:MAG: nitroreductase family protein [Candidatus Acidiferrales bacterium]
MERPAETKYPIHELLRRRWSPRAFAEKPVEPDKLLSLLEAARWAPSSFNEQPWAFLVATRDNPEEYARLLNCLVEGNQQWARLAPVLMLSLAKLAFDRNQKPNRHAFHDVGLAAESLVIQAMALGLFVHQMAGIEVEKIRQVYALPPGWEPVAGIALGYAGELERLPEKLRERELAPRQRKPLETFTFTGRFGQASPFLTSTEQPR